VIRRSMVVAALVAGAFTLLVSAAQAVPQVSAARAVAQPERVTTAAGLWCYDAYWGWYLCAWGLIS
jgi:hypothetical protein